jgi:hypothetical protein
MGDQYDHDETIRVQAIDDSVVADPIAVVASQLAFEPFERDLQRELESTDRIFAVDWRPLFRKLDELSRSGRRGTSGLAAQVGNWCELPCRDFCFGLS